MQKQQEDTAAAAGLMHSLAESGGQRATPPSGLLRPPLRPQHSQLPRSSGSGAHLPPPGPLLAASSTPPSAYATPVSASRATSGSSRPAHAAADAADVDVLAALGGTQDEATGSSGAPPVAAAAALAAAQWRKRGQAAAAAAAAVDRSRNGSMAAAPAATATPGRQQSDAVLLSMDSEALDGVAAGEEPPPRGGLAGRPLYQRRQSEAGGEGRGVGGVGGGAKVAPLGPVGGTVTWKEVPLSGGSSLRLDEMPANSPATAAAGGKEPRSSKHRCGGRACPFIACLARWCCDGSLPWVGGRRGCGWQQSREAPHAPAPVLVSLVRRILTKEQLEAKEALRAKMEGRTRFAFYACGNRRVDVGRSLKVRRAPPQPHAPRGAFLHAPGGSNLRPPAAFARQHLPHSAHARKHTGAWARNGDVVALSRLRPGLHVRTCARSTGSGTSGAPQTRCVTLGGCRVPVAQSALSPAVASQGWPPLGRACVRRWLRVVFAVVAWHP